MNPEAASSAKRDATLLRLLSWLSFRLEPAVEKLLEATMLYLSTVDEVKDSELFELGRMHLEVDSPFVSAEALRDHLIELISVRNLRRRPEALFVLFRQFLQRLTLPRICHFLDLVLPQLTPVRAPWADATRTLWTCHHIRATAHENGHPYEPRVTIAYFFTSHDHIHHVRMLWGTLPLLLFSDPRMVYPVNVHYFQGQAVHRLHKQHIQLGLRKGMAVLVYCRVQMGTHANTVFQAVLIAHESAATRGKNTENRLWKRVVPSETEFAWLPPDIAWAFCSDALRRRSDCQYLAFHEAHMGLHGRAFQANIFIVDMVFLGDTRSAEELAVFTNMAPERLCLGCGLRVDEKFTPIFPGERGPLFAASVKLLQFALRVSSASAFAKELTEEEDALRQAIRPLVMNPDCHFLAVLTVLVQSILEGRTDCPISGVFGAGKTRAGYRNTVLRTKQVIIGCGGGFHQECTQPYSPVARWMADVDVALNDEGQQYGNLDEASAIAKNPRKGMVIWCGDHKQTPGGLRKSEEARVFRRKLMRRPIALRGDTTFLPPHMLGAIVHPYVKDVPGPQMTGVNQLLQESTKQPLGLSTGSVAVFQELCKETIGSCWEAGITPCCCAAIAVLWLALAPERFPLQADTFSCAAGTAGKQK
eukprot:symbB.v1.2.036564.t1/scaffold5191.1/size29933/1